MKKVIPIVVVLALAAIAVLAWSQWETEPYHVSGFIETDEIRVGSRVGGRVKEVLVAEGEAVTADQPLLALEPYDLHERQAEAEAQLAAHQAQLTMMEHGLRPEEIAEAQARRDQAKAVLDKRIAGPRPLEIKMLESQVAVYKAEVAKAQYDYDRVKRLYGEKQAAHEELEDVTRQLEVMQARLAAAEQELALSKEGTRAEDIAEARASLAQQEAALELAKQGYRSEEIEQARAQVAAAEADVAAIRRQIDELTIKAPEAAVVEANDLQPGDLVSASAPVLSLLATDSLWVRAYVPESRLNLKTGQTVSIRVDAWPARRFAGRISYVSRQAEFTPQNVQTPEERVKQVFRIKVQIIEGRDVLRAGMAADVYLDAEPQP